MNRKKIKQHLRKVHNALIETITDPIVQDLVRKNTIISGGAIASLLTGTEPNDYDLYFKDRESLVLVTKYYLEFFGDKPLVNEDYKDRVYVDVSRNKGFLRRLKTDEEIKNKKLFLPKVVTNNAISLHNKVQIITRFFGEPEEILKNFDYIHCCNYWESETGELILKQEAVESLLMKRLTYQGSLYPLCSIFRLRKFIKRGWTVSGGQILKMSFQLSELDLTNLKVLEDQLVGVDTLFFVNLLARIKSDNPICINDSYVSQLVDEIFENGE